MIKKIFIALFFLFNSSAQESASSEKIKYLLSLSGLNSLTEKTRDYLFLSELNKNKDLISKKDELKKIVFNYYTEDKVEALLIENFKVKFNLQEVNKLIAIFETKEMKKIFSVQPDLIKAVLKSEQALPKKELVEEILKIK